MHRIVAIRVRIASAILVIFAMTGLILAACAAGGAATQGAAAPAAKTGAGERDAALMGSLAQPSGQPAQATGVNQPEQQIVKTGEMTLQVADVVAASGRVRALAVELGGYVGGSQAGSLDQAATLTLRIPAARFDDALSRLHAIGDKVLVEATREEDVTSAVVDLQARLKNLEASEAQYRALMARAVKIDDILAVQTHLDDVQGQIEQLTAQLKQLSNQASLATLTVTLQPQPQPIKAASATWDPGDTASTAVGALLTVGQALASAAIWFGIVGLPILVGLAIVLLVLARLGLLRRPTVRSAAPEA